MGNFTFTYIISAPPPLYFLMLNKNTNRVLSLELFYSWVVKKMGHHQQKFPQARVFLIIVTTGIKALMTRLLLIIVTTSRKSLMTRLMLIIVTTSKKSLMSVLPRTSPSSGGAAFPSGL